MDRRVTYVGAVPLGEDFLEPQRAAMVGLAELSEAVLGRGPTIDGLLVAPTTPTSLAVNVGVGSIYAAASLDAQAYGSLPADTAHSIVKQGVQLDPLRIPIAPPGTPGFSQTFLLQANFQEVDAGAVVLPYYNSANPSQAWAGPSNSGTQQYTRRNGSVVVQVKAGTPAATGSQSTPTPDAGWVGLAWVTVASGQAVVLAQHITQYSGPHRIPRKLPALGRIAGGATTVVTGARNLTAEEAGLVVLDLGAWSDDVPIRLPPVNTAPGEPMRFTIAGRYITARTRRALSWGRVTAAPGDIMEQPFVYCGPDDVVSFVSDGVSRWVWTGGRASSVYSTQAAGNQVIPNAINTAINLQPPASSYTSGSWYNPAYPDLLIAPRYGRYRITASVAFNNAPGGYRWASFNYNGVQASAPFPWVTVPATGSGYATILNVVSPPLGMYDGDYIQLMAFQDSTAPLAIQAANTWVTVESVYS